MADETMGRGVPGAQVAVLEPVDKVGPCTAPGTSTLQAIVLGDRRLAELVGSWLSNQAHSPASKRVYLIELRQFVRYATASGLVEPASGAGLWLDRVELRHLLAYKERISGSCKPTTVRRRLATLKSLFRFAFGQRYCSHDPSAALRLPRGTSPEPEILSQREVEDLRRAVPDKRRLHGLRDLALIQVLLVGLRESEVVALNDDTSLVTKWGRPALQVLGKGGKFRTIVLPEEVAEAIAAYQRARGPSLPPERPLFLTLRRSGREPQRISADGVVHAVRRAARRAGLGRRVGPHLLRHTSLSHAHQGGASLAEVQRLGGHASLASVQIYQHLVPSATAPLDHSGLFGGSAWRTAWARGRA